MAWTPMVVRTFMLVSDQLAGINLAPRFDRDPEVVEMGGSGDGDVVNGEVW